MDQDSDKKKLSKCNTFYKVIIWRMITLCITISILLIVMDDVQKAITTGIIDHSICLVAHYFYERFWIKCFG